MSTTKGQETLREVHIARRIWAEALDKDFDAIHLQAIKNVYEAALRKNETFCALYDEQREAWRADLKEREQEVRAELASITKKGLAKLAGFADDSNAYESLTKEHLISSVVRFRQDDIESEHSRVKRIWDAMSEAQREGLEPRYV